MDMEQQALQAAIKKNESNEPAPDTLKEPINPEDTIREVQGGDKDLEAVGQVAGVAREVAEQPVTGEYLNKLVEKADDSAIMNGIRKVWDGLPGWAQKGIIDPKARAIYNVSFIPGLGLTAEGFNTLVRTGLLELKGAEGGGKELEKMRQQGETMDSYVQKFATVATGGEGGEIISKVIELKNVKSDLEDKARVNLEEVRARKKAGEIQKGIDQMPDMKQAA